jgi:putative endonuclease
MPITNVLKVIDMAYTYILKCSDSSYYTGSTKNMERRLWQHQNGEGAYHTKVRLPVTLVYVEHYDRVEEAFAREKQIQGWSRKKKEALIYSNIDDLQRLSKCTLRQAQGTVVNRCTVAELAEVK